MNREIQVVGIKKIKSKKGVEYTILHCQLSGFTKDVNGFEVKSLFIGPDSNVVGEPKVGSYLDVVWNSFYMGYFVMITVL